MKQNIAKFTFLYLLALGSLIFTTISVGNVFFELINKNFVDLIDVYEGRYSPDSLKFAIASLIIAAPLYFVSMRFIKKGLKSKEIANDSALRRWFTYLIIFVAGVTMIGWLIGFIYSYLDGDLSVKFSLKALAVFVIGAIVGSYYYFDIAGGDKKVNKKKLDKIYLFGALGVVLVSLILGIFFVESPAETRQRKIDELNISKLSKIEGAIANYYHDIERLPSNLGDVVVEVDYLIQRDLKDDVRDKGFEYILIDDKKYKLCADFYLTNKNIENENRGHFREAWLHDAGYECFVKKVRDEKVMIKK